MLIPDVLKNVCLYCVLLVLGCELNSHVVFAQYRFDSWTTDDGLPVNTVSAIKQTRDGYLWLATLDGLARFDGARFTVFDRSNTKEFASNRCTALFEDADGGLWVGTEDGGVMRYSAGRFVTTFTTANGLPHNHVFYIHGDSGGGVLITTAGGQITWREGRLADGTPANVRRYVGPSGTRWQVNATGVHRIRAGRQDTESFPLPYPIPLSSPQCVSLRLFEDRSGNLWIGAADLGLVRVGTDGASIYYAEREAVTRTELVEEIYEDREGTIWIGTRGKGLLCFRQGRFSVYTTADGLATNFIRSIGEDREGTLWLGTTNRGLIRVSRRFITTYSVRDGLVFNNVHPISQDRAGRIWIGTAAGLSIFQNGRFTNYTKKDGLRRDGVQAFCEDKDGHMWVGLAGGLLQFQNGKITNRTALVGDVTVLAICQDRSGAMWFGTDRRVFRWRPEQGDTVEHFTIKHGLPNDDVKAIHEDRQGRLWFGTFGGLAQFQDGRFTSYTAADGLAGNRVRSIYEDTEGVLWIGTYDDGLSRFREGRFASFKVENGLYNNGVFQILEDARSYFWMSSNKGIHRVSKQQLNDFAAGRVAGLDGFAYGKQDGMLSIGCNGGRQPGGIKARDGKLWFPTQEGVVVVDPEAVPFNPLPPPVLIESVSLERNLLDFRQGVTVKPGQRYLEIAYTGLSFLKAEQVRFKYKLEGQDADWIDVGTRRTAYYAQLSPGTYTFKVIAANSDGVWNNQGASLQLRVIPPFYRTWWFLGLMAMMLMGLAVTFYRWRIAQLKQEHARQTAFSRRLIDSQETERKRIAAELHDSLGQSLIVIKNQSVLSLHSLDDPQDLEEQITSITSAAAQAIQEMKDISHNLRPYLLDRLGLKLALESMLKKAAASGQLQITTELDAIDKLFPSESEIHVYRLVQEALNNILKHAHATRARVQIRRHDHHLAILIEDNGRGFLLAEQTSQQSSQATQTGGFGLTGSSERARLLGGNYSIASQPGQGTRVIIEIPYQGAIPS